MVVTGAASGIGAACAESFLAEGAVVIAGDQEPDAVPEGCRPYKVDVSSEVEVKGLIAEALATTDRLDVVCNNAGIGSTTDALNCSVEEWDRVFAVNARGVFLGTKHALTAMVPAGRGAIVNTASVGGLVGLNDRAAYCASKGAVIAFTKQVALQYAGTGVRCNCVCPGTVDSPWVARLMQEAADPVERRSMLIARQPVGRLGTPEEIAKAILYLASDDASFITGSALVIDGGLTAG
ncbi:MAG TPA: SDR family oxidoreductase [Actinomycetota bacterium]|nr:SDR family oxidoreductase [Actinomycetota bacterium]